MAEREQKISIDNPVSISAVIAISIIGLLFFLGMPVIMGAFVEQLGYSERQIGWFSSVEFGAVGLASIAASTLISRFNRRSILFFGLAATAVGSCLSLFVIENFSLILWTRLLAGFGGGLCYAVGLAILAGSRYTARTFSILIFAQGLTSSLELLALPPLVAQWGVKSVFLLFICLAILGFGLVRWVPAHLSEQEDKLDGSSHERGSVLAAACCLLSVFLFCVMVGTIWTFIERVGVSLGQSAEFVGTFLSIANLLNLVGCFVAYWIAKRLGISLPLLVSLGLMTGAMFLMGFKLSLNSYLVGTSIFFLCWALTDIYQTSAVSNLDHSGRITALIPAAQSVGITSGPALTALFFGEQADYSLLLMFSGSCMAATMAVYSVVHLFYREGVDSDGEVSADLLATDLKT